MVPMVVQPFAWDVCTQKLQMGHTAFSDDSCNICEHSPSCVVRARAGGFWVSGLGEAVLMMQLPVDPDACCSIALIARTEESRAIAALRRKQGS